MATKALKILAVDDEPDNLLLLKVTLKQLFPGAKFYGAGTGKDGIALALKKDPDVIILDIIMPGMDGFETCRRMKADPLLRHIPVIFVTAFKTDKESRIAALETGGEGFLSKPLEEAELTAQIRSMAKIKAAAVFQLKEHERLETLVARRTRDLENEVCERRNVEKKINASLAEKEVLLKEIHHRVKNNLQVVSSLLNLQSKAISDAAAQAAFKESRARVSAMALVHETLYRAPDLTNLNMREYISKLIGSLIVSYRSVNLVSLNSDICDCTITVDTAVSLGLILNELVSNSLKHAFSSGRAGTIRVSLVRESGGYCLGVEDDGPGLPVDYCMLKAKSLGMQLVTALTKQISGTIETEAGSGARFRVHFPGSPIQA